MINIFSKEVGAICARLAAIFVLAQATPTSGQESAATPVALPESWSGIYPLLAYFNDEDECGTGAVVPWADRLWMITYAPHQPKGSTDKLYEITQDFKLIERPESIGGTPANRMIHEESRQLFIGPYAIDHERNVRTIPYEQMIGRPTGNARHLTDPASKIYYATMEEGLYEVDVKTLRINRLFADTHEEGAELPRADLPGYHGKGVYSGQGVVVYANNGENSEAALTKPFIPSGALAEWDGKEWRVVRRNQFTEVTGPGGLNGNPNPATDPIWSIGWDHKSLILMVRDSGNWHSYRLPKSSHSYDGAHGWNTEWPRIRDIGEDSLLMTMHGTFWSFPKTFSAGNSAGIAPRSTYLKVVGDFCRWGDQIVLGCDDAAKSEFTNTRKAKGKVAGPQSHSNLWFLKPDQLDLLGPVIGHGAVWQEDAVLEGDSSEPFLFSGYERRGLHLMHKGLGPVELVVEVDPDGTGKWRPLRTIRLLAREYRWISFSPIETGSWIRLTSRDRIIGATAVFEYSNKDTRATEQDSIFRGLASAAESDDQLTGGVIRTRGDNKRTLQFAARTSSPEGPQDIGYYELDGTMKLKKTDDAEAHRLLKENVTLPENVLRYDASSVIFTTDSGKHYRLPRNELDYDSPGKLGADRVDREVCTERDLLNAAGTFYELPADNAGGIAKIRPLATHNLQLNDYCSYRGLLVMSGLNASLPEGNRHIIRSDDNRTALWVGAIDDVWKLGKVRGTGGPWLNTPVRAGQASDPYLMTGYDKKTMKLSHSGNQMTIFYVQVDLSGHGLWAPYERYEVDPDTTFTHEFPDGFSAYWIRLITDREVNATALFVYE
ncbi:MAG: hypothetical protein O3C21_08750 [Verrucomicrobia bacterium]|nr:hypothetical protein [Verrucomicrobiota bacterium]